LPVPTNPVILKKAAAAQAAKEQKEAKEAKAKEKAAAGDESQKEERPREEKRKSEEKPKEELPKGDDEEEKHKETLPASWLKPVKWFMGQFDKDSGTLYRQSLNTWCFIKGTFFLSFIIQSSDHHFTGNFYQMWLKKY